MGFFSQSPKFQSFKKTSWKHSELYQDWHCAFLYLVAAFNALKLDWPSWKFAPLQRKPNRLYLRGPRLPNSSLTKKSFGASRDLDSKRRCAAHSRHQNDAKQYQQQNHKPVIIIFCVPISSDMVSASCEARLRQTSTYASDTHKIRTSAGPSNYARGHPWAATRPCVQGHTLCHASSGI